MSTTKVITGMVRFSYANVWEPRAMDENSEPKYSVSILIPKKDKVTLKKIKDAIEAAKEQGKSKWGGKIPGGLKLPLRDGDTDKPDNPEYEDCMFLTASSSQRPGIIDAQMNDILDKDEFYSGCYGRASLNFYAFAVGSKGVAVGLNNLQKLKDGDNLTGRTSAQDDFGSEEYEEDDLMS